MPIGSHWTQVETVDSSHRLTPDQIEAQQFERASQLEPKQYSPAYNLGLALTRAGQPGKAVTAANSLSSCVRRCATASRH